MERGGRGGREGEKIGGRRKKRKRREGMLMLFCSLELNFKNYFVIFFKSDFLSSICMFLMFNWVF